MSNNKYYILYDTKYIEGDIYGGPIFLTNDFKKAKHHLSQELQQIKNAYEIESEWWWSDEYIEFLTKCGKKILIGIDEMKLDVNHRD